MRRHGTGLFPAQSPLLPETQSAHQRRCHAGPHQRLMARECSHHPHHHQRGLSLVELMVGTVLGMVLVAGMLGLLLQQRQAFRAIDGLGRLQENARFAFEMLTRDGREAGMSPCGTLLTANVIRPAGGAPWWADTDAGMIRGFDDAQDSADIIGFGTQANRRTSGTDALLMLGPASGEDTLVRVTSHDPTAQSFTVASTGSLQAQDIVLACDGSSSALLQISAVNTATHEISYAGSALNCSTQLGAVGTGCATPSAKTFGQDALLVRWEPVFWYVGANDGGSRSLFRAGIARGSGGAVITSTEEVTRDVLDLQLSFLTRNPLQGQALATNWIEPASFNGNWALPTAEVSAVQLTLTLRSPTDSGAHPLERKLVALAVPRQRNP